jgi:hypothetical protein
LKIHLNTIPPSNHWSLQVVSFTQVSPPERLCTSLLFTRATCLAHLILLALITGIIFVGEYRSWRSSIGDLLQSFFSVCFFQLPSVILYLVCVRSGLILSLFLTGIFFPGCISRTEIIRRKSHTYSKRLTCFESDGCFYTKSSFCKDNFMFTLKKLFCLSDQQ